ncbi:leucyl/phenylalanyl-tRNA--protein transferase [Formosa sp. Hel1_33_131]|jgi:leucyl/phenylalanyl-tRNA--protein transferase|uniref:leucyl/phenylalanyl-tRNA--protein transferase n=1 Tax=Formosa sp. Hel1_33_131 TaxID=1336794 RepID=UPI00084E232C|nr:leucyl/phenylalanyl-tRNA--protein transferase [Formosa sp. Hel1_33_131]AOR27972.1 leucyl/phenylalanyl-tRNA--protein transferase [Formosa sp. Hel1_33_131]
MKWLNETIEFPPLTEANSEGLLAVGGDLSPERVLFAYQNGIFPWYESDQPILWWAPDPRFVLYPHKLKVSKSTKQILKNQSFEITVNRNFKEVIQACAKVKREAQSGTWITDKMIETYCELHQRGIAKSVEVWQNKKLVGGLYGVELNDTIFCGESMFSYVSNASKIGFTSFVQNSKYKLIDCQLHTNHLESLGAESISRIEFMKYLKPQILLNK